MDILVDTHILIWIVGREDKLSPKRLRLLADYNNRVCVSQISLRELAIKKRINKLPEFIAEIDDVGETWLNNGYEILPLRNEHIFRYQHIPLFDDHKDPFDRFLIATALHEHMAIMTDDSKFRLYEGMVQLL